MISGSTHYIEIDGEKYKLCLDEDDNYYIIKDDKKTIIEYDDNILEYLPMIANDLSFCPHFADALNEHFKENIDKYPLDVLFPMAAKSEYYNNEIYTDKRPEFEILTKRIFVLLYGADRRFENYSSYIRKMIESYPPAKPVVDAVKNKDKAYFFKIGDDTSKNRMEKILLQSLFILYIRALEDKDIEKYYRNLKERDIFPELSERLSGSYSSEKNKIDKINPFEKIIVHRNHRKAFESIKTGSDLCDLLNLTSQDIAFARNGINNTTLEVTPEIANLCLSKDDIDVDEMEITLSSFNAIVEAYGYNGKSITAILRDIPFTVEEHKAVVKLIVSSESEYDNKSPVDLTFEKYVVYTTYFLLAKSMKKSGEFFSLNNRETEIFSAQAINEEKEYWKNETFKAEADRDYYVNKYFEIEEEIAELKKSFAEQAIKQKKDITQSAERENALLLSKIKKLEKELQERKAESEEIYRLRELVFDKEKEQPVPTEKIDLNAVLKGLKVVFIGGHISLRNKLHEKYKDLIIIDGINENFDEKILLSADLVLFYTNNMSHKSYQKAMLFIRAYQVRFDYVGRTTNPDLLENEIGMLIKKNIK